MSKKNYYFASLNKLSMMFFMILVLAVAISCKRTPVANLKSDIEDGIAPLSINFNAGGSYARDGSITSYKWNFGDSTPVVVNNQSTMTHTYSTAGQYWANVTVVDSNGLTSTSPNILVSVVNMGEGDISLGDLSFAGSGCPEGSAQAVLAPDKKSVSVLFDEFAASAGTSYGGNSIDNKNCSVSIPVIVPNGYSISVYKLDYRGFAEVPANAEAKLHVDYFFAGSSGVSLDKKFPGEYSSDFTITDNLVAYSDVWSKCGEEVILRANTSITAKSNNLLDDTTISIDSTDIATGITYHVRYQVCN